MTDHLASSRRAQQSLNTSENVLEGYPHKGNGEANLGRADARRVLVFQRWYKVRHEICEGIDIRRKEIHLPSWAVSFGEIIGKLSTAPA